MIVFLDNWFRYAFCFVLVLCFRISDKLVLDNCFVKHVVTILVEAFGLLLSWQILGHKASAILGAFLWFENVVLISILNHECYILLSNKCCSSISGWFSLVLFTLFLIELFFEQVLVELLHQHCILIILYVNLAHNIEIWIVVLKVIGVFIVSIHKVLQTTISFKKL